MGGQVKKNGVPTKIKAMYCKKDGMLIKIKKGIVKINGDIATIYRSIQRISVDFAWDWSLEITDVGPTYITLDGPDEGINLDEGTYTIELQSIVNSLENFDYEHLTRATARVYVDGNGLIDTTREGSTGDLNQTVTGVHLSAGQHHVRLSAALQTDETYSPGDPDAGVDETYEYFPGSASGTVISVILTKTA